MDIVYRYRATKHGHELRLSLRSLRNLPHDRVWVFGEGHPWFSDRIEHVSVPQDRGTKWANSLANIREAVNHPEVSEDFIMMDDDFFVLRPVEIRHWHRGTIEEYFGGREPRGNYNKGLAVTAELMQQYGFEGPYYAYNLHLPMIVNKTLMREALALADDIPAFKRPVCFHLRSWYGNYAKLGGEKIKDVKVSDFHRKLDDRDFVSTTDRAFVGMTPIFLQLRALFPDPSPYEE